MPELVLKSRAHIIANNTPPNERPFVLFALRAAEDMRQNAGFSGSMHDDGAGALEDAIEAYVAGLNKEVPKGLKDLHKKFERSSDPKYAQYLELKKQFED